ncbi:hypothetical protein GOP47_0007780 [Adiantum capillus-veneris]|uniref:WEB family protein n=1 Tax=Adiantum capillus-veneris TaxID=13818 RepID=A0A9D4V1D5_ADICA|nr:hypothetical protein GOP47_0007780 [Adiantum capillus-veneris]
MFGEKVNVKRSQTIEKPNLKNSELHQLKEELAAMKLKLSEAEEAKDKVYEELRDTRKLLEMTVCGEPCVVKQFQISSAPMMQEDRLHMDISKPGSPFPEQSNKSNVSAEQQPIHAKHKSKNNLSADGSDKGKTSIDASKQSNSKAEEKHVVWEVELKVAQEQHMNAVAELELVKNDLERLKEELVVSLREKESALRQAEEALMAAELNAKRVEELSHEMSANSGTSPHRPITSEHSMIIVEELETKLALATKELTRLQEELAFAKKAEVRVASAASEAYANLALAKSELEKTHMQSCVASGSSCTDFKMSKRELDKAWENGASLQATLDTLQSELEIMRKELVDLRDREAVARAAVVTLTAELARTKEDLASAIAAENKANEAVAVLTQTLQHYTVEADEARAATESLKEEATKARVDAEGMKCVLASAEQEMKVAIEAAEAAKAAENDALERFKALSERISETHSSGAAGGACGSISQDEYERLKWKVREAEDLANMKIAAANAQVEAVKMSEMELQQKMKVLSDDVDTMKSNTEQALKRAEIAESAKRVVESEMRKWRENGKGRVREFDTAGVKNGRGWESSTQRVHLQRDIQEMENASSQLVVVGSKSQSLSYCNAQPAESLAQVLNMKMPSLVSDARTLSDRSLGQKKKKHYILPSLSIFSSKKNHSLGGSTLEI